MPWIDAAAEALGRALAAAWVGYGLVILTLGTYGSVHALLCIVAWRFRNPEHDRSRWHRRLRWALELFYGFGNPLIYLAILAPNGIGLIGAGLLRPLLLVSAWTGLIAVWTYRLLWPRSLAQHSLAMTLVRWVLIGSTWLIAIIGVTDLVGFLRPIPEGRMRGDLTIGIVYILLSLSGLYLMPVLLLRGWIRVYAPHRPPGDAERFVVAPRLSRIFAAVVAIVLVATSLSALYRRSEAATQSLVARHRDRIVEAGERYGVDPALLASILFVNTRDQLSPFRDALERIAMAAWAWDATSNFSLGIPLNISVGLMQVKPATLQTAAVIRDHSVTNISLAAFFWLNADAWSSSHKEHRETPALDDTWMLSAPDLRRLSPPFSPPADKPTVVASLLDDQRNIDAAALILRLYQLHWEQLNPAWSIRERPDILATLYQIGFEKSHPKPMPQANAFGNRVQQVHDSAWMRAHFDRK